GGAADVALDGGAHAAGGVDGDLAEAGARESSDQRAHLARLVAAAGDPRDACEGAFVGGRDRPAGRLALDLPTPRAHEAALAASASAMRESGNPMCTIAASERARFCRAR